MKTKDPGAACPLCGAEGTALRSGLGDRMYDAPGTWGHRLCPAPACGLLWLDPMPRPEDLPSFYRAYFTHGERPPKGDGPLRRMAMAVRRGYLASRWKCGRGSSVLGLLARLHPPWRDELDLRAMHMEGKPGGRLLEVGCGNGDLLAGARDHGWAAEGLDFDPAAVAAARARGLSVREGDLSSAAFPASAFDAVVAVHLVEHVPDPAAFLDEAARVLAPGGRLVLVTPNLRSRGARRFGAAWRELDPPRHLHLFPPRTLARLVEGRGFRVDSLRTSLRDARGVYSGSRSIERTGRCAMGEAGEPVRGRLFVLGSILARLLDPLSAEETILVATSSGRPSSRSRGTPS
jgi:SAM-dependent methyltransferase